MKAEMSALCVIVFAVMSEAIRRTVATAQGFERQEELLITVRANSGGNALRLQAHGSSRANWSDEL